MTITFRRSYWKAVGVVFTSVVAPIVLKIYDGSTTETPAPVPDPVPMSVPAEPLPQTTASTTRVVAKGTGATPEAAFQNAVDAALQQSVATEVTVAEWGRYGRQYMASLRKDGSGVLRGWRELSTATERHLTGRVYKSEVVVDVDAAALRQRLRPAAKPAAEGTTPPARLGLATVQTAALPNANRFNQYGPVVLAGAPRDIGQR